MGESRWSAGDVLELAGTTGASVRQDPATRVTLDPGMTPLVSAPGLAAAIGLQAPLWVKDDSANPTHSFKDRVVSVALTAARGLGFTRFACASTGNLANSVAAHAARAGAPSIVFIPYDLEQGKVVTTAIYGGDLVAIEGSYDDVNRLCGELVAVLGLDDVPAQHDREAWPRMREMFARVFLTRTRDEWAAAFEGVDGCVAPVLDLAEAPDGAHLAARGTFTEAFGVVQPTSAPRLSRTPGRIRSAPPTPGADSREVLSDWGFDKADVDALVALYAVHLDQFGWQYLRIAQTLDQAGRAGESLDWAERGARDCPRPNERLVASLAALAAVLIVVLARTAGGSPASAPFPATATAALPATPDAPRAAPTAVGSTNASMQSPPM